MANFSRALLAVTACLALTQLAAAQNPPPPAPTLTATTAGKFVRAIPRQGGVTDNPGHWRAR